MAKLTMTVHEVVQAMRQAGIQCTARIVSNGIASGMYPFGTVVSVGETGRRTLQIFRVDFEAWIESKTPKANQLQLIQRTG